MFQEADQPGAGQVSLAKIHLFLHLRPRDCLGRVPLARKVSMISGFSMSWSRRWAPVRTSSGIGTGSSALAKRHPECSWGRPAGEYPEAPGWPHRFLLLAGTTGVFHGTESVPRSSNTGGSMDNEQPLRVPLPTTYRPLCSCTFFGVFVLLLC